jgi:hypothetical protein
MPEKKNTKPNIFSKTNLLYSGLTIILLAAAVTYLFTFSAPKNIPQVLLLQVPFSTQAPNDNWSRNEDCEETSVTMANAFLTGSTEEMLPGAAAQQAIDNLKKWEVLNLGYNANTGADATAQMAQGAFGLKVNQLKNFTENDLKTALTNNHPVLLPINAKLLGNTQYKNGGPLYHMIVLRGFKGDTFIVNDPGTDSGNSNTYLFDILQRASANWNQVSKSIDPSQKIALEIFK